MSRGRKLRSDLLPRLVETPSMVRPPTAWRSLAVGILGLLAILTVQENAWAQG
jgi:hypothetical protein